MREKINVYVKNKMKTDLKYKLAHNISVRTSQAFESQNVRKLGKTFDLIECSQSFFRKWILYQLYSDMTEETYGSVWIIDHCYPLSKTDLSIGTDKIKTTCWIILRLMYFNKNISKGYKNDNRLYLTQGIKACQFIQLNDKKRLHQNFY